MIRSVGPTRARAGIVVALVAAVTVSTAACRTQAPPAGSAGDTASEALGTAGAPDADGTVAVGAGDASAGIVSQAEALATLNAITGGAAGSSEADPGSGAPGSMDAEAQATFAAAQATQDTEAGIADVNALVQSMPPLATFTPPSNAADLSGSLTYVRGGRFYRARASGGPGEPLSAELPNVWSPPEDPGRAWTSPDGKRMAFFGGPDAELWVMDVDGDNARPVSEANLPTDAHVVVADGRQSDARLRPGTDYTLIVVPGRDAGVIVLTDDNSRHIRGEARLRVVHASERYADTPLQVNYDGAPLFGPIAYGESSPNERVLVGQIGLQIADDRGASIATLPAFPASDRELKTVFLYGDDKLAAAQFDYEPGQPPSGHSRVRVFNASDGPVDVMLDDGRVVSEGLEPGLLGNYVDVPALLSMDARQDAELALYGLRAGEDPVSWSSDSGRVAFVGFGDGQADLYVADVDGDARRVSNDDSREINPHWSPNGKMVVWGSIEEATDHHSVRWMVDDGKVATIDTAPIINAMGWSASAPVKYPQAIGWADGETVYFYPQADGQSGGIWLFDVGSGDLLQAYDQPLKEVEFSPEAESWALVASTRLGEIVTVDLEGQERTVASGDAWAPIWSPDGRAISWVEGDRLSTVGWRIHVVDADGSNDRTLTDWLPVLQSEPPVPGPNAKRSWLDDGRVLAFTRAGRDYGAAERAGIGGTKAGDDIENVWIVPTDGSAPPSQATDLTRVFYLRGPEPSPNGDTLALVGFSYLDRVQWLWTMPLGGGKPQKIDGGVRWYAWDR